MQQVRRLSLRWGGSVLAAACVFVLWCDGAAQAQEPKSPVGIDFSYAGYGAGAPLPWVAAVLRVAPTGGDDTELLQQALDRVAAMPLRADGFRGALLLSPGRFRVQGQLHLRASGVVLRGSGDGAQGTVIEATGRGRRSLIEVGADLLVTENGTLAMARAVRDDVPAGGMRLSLDSVDGLAAGDRVVVRRPSTQAWISAMGMSGLPGTFANQRLDWQPGSHDLVWDRTIVSIDAGTNSVTLDAPITTALETRYGGGTLAKVIDDVVPHNIGIERLTLESDYDHAQPKDEEHAWTAIALDHVQDAWVRFVRTRHFVSSAVRVNWRGRRITVEDVHSEAPVSEIAGYRRQAFLVDGQQVLVEHCTSEAGMNDFASGMLAGGPNVFFDDSATASIEASGAFEGWASGVLYEQVHVPAARLQLLYDFARAQGAGWTAANSVIWNSTAQSVDAIGPPGAPNFVVNSKDSLYRGQLRARLGREPAPDAPLRTEAVRALPRFRASDVVIRAEVQPQLKEIAIENGRFVVDGKVLWGPSQGEAWWRGDTSIYTAGKETGSSVTRFMPGVVAPGLTEDLQTMVERMVARHAVAIQVNPGLWYDHRRDAHNVERRANGDVWAPFFEVPWARSGQGVAWDGLSKFDLSRYNPYYFERERAFATEAAKAGIVVFYDLYNTHNVLEIGPHWIDYAWRPANNINDTGLPEPPPFKPHGRNDVGNAFYSVDYAPLRALHRAYILHTLDVMGDLPNVIFGVAYQYAGPLSFEQFFQDTVREWEQQHHRHIRIALTTSKQTTDAILSDPVRSKQIAVVDMRYWEYEPDGTLFAPKAGIDSAFREQISKAFPGYTDTPPPTTPEMVYREVREYRDRYPQVALMPMEEGTGRTAILMAGAASPSGLTSRPKAPTPTAQQQASGMYPTAAKGAAPNAQAEVPAGSGRVVDAFIEQYLAGSLMKMSPQDGWVDDPEHTWVLAGGAAEPVLIDSLQGDAIALRQALPSQRYSALWFDPETGRTLAAEMVSGRWPKPDSREWLLLLRPQ